MSAPIPTVLAIDGGVTGALALVTVEHKPRLLDWRRMAPALDLAELIAEMIGDTRPPCYVEEALSVPSDKGRRTQARTYHAAVGAVHGAVGALGLAVTVVTVAQWQKQLGFGDLWGKPRDERKREIRRRLPMYVRDVEGVPIYAADAVAIGAWAAREELLRARTAPRRSV